MARTQEYRCRDVVAKEVAQVWAQLQVADERGALAEGEWKHAWTFATRSLEGRGQIIRVAGDVEIVVIHPQSVVATMQSPVQAYFNYHGSIADYHRAQFRLYRRMEIPRCMQDHDGLLGPVLPGAGMVESVNDRIDNQKLK